MRPVLGGLASAGADAAVPSRHNAARVLRLERGEVLDELLRVHARPCRSNVGALAMGRAPLRRTTGANFRSQDGRLPRYLLHWCEAGAGRGTRRAGRGAGVIGRGASRRPSRAVTGRVGNLPGSQRRKRVGRAEAETSNEEVNCTAHENRKQRPECCGARKVRRYPKKQRRWSRCDGDLAYLSAVASLDLASRLGQQPRSRSER
jgi:hypothetical protein